VILFQFQSRKLIYKLSGFTYRRDAIEAPSRLKVGPCPWRTNTIHHPTQDRPRIFVNSIVIQRLKGIR
jgi:hypothetical protein